MWCCQSSVYMVRCQAITLQWRHNEHDSVSNHQPHDCLFNRLFGRRSKKISKLRVTGLCAGNSPGTGEFPAQRASNAENVSIWWRHHDLDQCWDIVDWTHRNNLNEIFIEFHTFSFKKSIGKCRLENDVHFVSAPLCQEAVSTYFSSLIVLDLVLEINTNCVVTTKTTVCLLFCGSLPGQHGIFTYSTC